MTSGISVHFIVVSGYRYFEYAQRALKYGVKDYLLKPINETELNKILEKVCAEEKQKQSLENRVETLEKDLFHSRHMLHRELMERAFSEAKEHKTEDEVHTVMPEEEVMGSGHFRAAALKVDRDIARDWNMQKEQLIMQKLSEKAEEWLQALTIDLVVSVKDGMWMMLLLNFREDDSTHIREALETMFYKMRDYISGFEGYEITMGCSPEITEFSKINLILEISREAGELGLIIKKCFEEAERMQLMASEYYGLGHGLIEEYGAAVLELFQTETKEMAQWEEAAGHCRTVGSLQKYVKEVLKENLEALRKHREDLERKPVLNAIRYVQQNYGQKILLEDVAEMSGFNANYFSEIFKKETGKNFTAFLLEVRIERLPAQAPDVKEYFRNFSTDSGRKTKIRHVDRIWDAWRCASTNATPALDYTVTFSLS